ncbi:MAG: YraN family protein [Sulfurimonas sp.]|nr:MAG: YraN family protein [Sulfurimonas sp.]
MSRAKGNIAEDNTCQFLQQQGFVIMERNCYSRFGEIDIIARKENLVHFIEVKSAQDYEQAIQNVTPQKIKRIVKTVDCYLKKHALDVDYCIDAAIVTPDGVEFLENITF